jgi:hypothetical protein
LERTFGRAAVGNGLLAVAAGLTSQVKLFCKFLFNCIFHRNWRTNGVISLRFGYPLRLLTRSSYVISNCGNCKAAIGLTSAAMILIACTGEENYGKVT